MWIVNSILNKIESAKWRAKRAYVDLRAKIIGVP